MGRPEEEGMRPGDNDGENLVRRCVERKRFEKVACRQRGDEDSTAAFTKGVAGYWRSASTAYDRHSYKQIAGDLLVELGYESTKTVAIVGEVTLPRAEYPRAVCAALEHCSDFRKYRVLAEYLSVRLFHPEVDRSGCSIIRCLVTERSTRDRR